MAKRPAAPTPPDNYLRTCECGKRAYVSRQVARRVAKTAHPGEHMRAYQCGQFWHIGHNSPRRTP